MVAIGLSIVPANIVGAILRERERNLKHLQLISGLNLVAYHVVNIWFDIVKTTVIAFVCALMFLVWGLQDYYWAIFVLVLWPIVAVPTTHVLAFFFQTEWSAQFAVILYNLVVLGGLPILVASLMFNEQTMDTAERMNNGLLFLPEYSLSRALLFCGYQEQYTRFRKSVGDENYSREAWSPGNFGLNVTAIFAHAFFCVILVLMLDNVLGLPNGFKFLL